MMCKRLAEFMATYNKYCNDYSDEAAEFFQTFELELAKAFMLDFPDSSVRVAKIILAIHDIEEIKIKIE